MQLPSRHAGMVLLFSLPLYLQQKSVWRHPLRLPLSSLFNLDTLYDTMDGIGHYNRLFPPNVWQGGGGIIVMEELLIHKYPLWISDVFGYWPE